MVLSFSYWVSFSSDTILSDKNGLMVLQNILFSVKFFCQEYYNLTIYVRFFWQKKLFNCNQFLSFENVFPSIDLSIISLERVLSIKVFSFCIFLLASYKLLEFPGIYQEKMKILLHFLQDYVQNVRVTTGAGKAGKTGK